MTNIYKTLFDLKREKLQKIEISALWYKLMYKKIMNDHVIRHMENKTLRDRCEGH